MRRRHTAIIILSIATMLSACGTDTAYNNLEKQKPPVTQSATASTPVPPKPTPQPTPTPEEPKVVTSGQAGQIGDFELKVVKTNSTKKSGSKTTENQFVIITLDVKNIGNKAGSLSDSNFILLDDKDHQYEANTLDILPWDVDRISFSTQINPGLKKTGSIAFEIPSDVENIALAVRDNMFDFGGAKYIFFQL